MQFKATCVALRPPPALRATRQGGLCGAAASLQRAQALPWLSVAPPEGEAVYWVLSGLTKLLKKKAAMSLYNASE